MAEEKGAQTSTDADDRLSSKLSLVQAHDGKVTE
jgi:hypothetical protein